MVKKILYRLSRFLSIFGGYSSPEDIARAQRVRQAQRAAWTAAEAAKAERGECQPPDTKA